MHIHFIGIGGIGVSALARHFLLNGDKVTGSDLTDSEIIQSLIKEGAKVSIGHSKDNIGKNIDKVIFSPAIPKDNPERKKADRLGLTCQSYPQALGELTKDYFTIAVSGTHGKSTTTSMAGLMMDKAGLDPTVIVGTKLTEFNNSNYKKGDSKYLLIEADEWQGSLLNYSPDIVVLTNLELEHLDYYKDLDSLVATFQDYLKNIKKDGKVILNGEDENLKKLKTDKKTYKFSKKEKIADKVKSVLKVPGDHNLENGLAVFKLGDLLGVDKETILAGLSLFKGTWRRFEQKKITVGGSSYELILDYAHHPTELRAVLEACREKFPQKEIWAIFQPHQYQRSLHLKDDFKKVFSESPVDKLFITDIYSVPGREKEEIKKKINSKKLTEKTKACHLSGDLDDLAQFLRDNLQGDELMVIIGAGDIYKLEASLKGYKNQ